MRRTEDRCPVVDGGNVGAGVAYWCRGKVPSEEAMERIEFYRHGLGEAELDEIRRTLGTAFLTAGPQTARFEAAFGELLGLKHVVGTSSCTASLHLALLACGIGPGDEVIVPAMTFVASVNPVWWVGAKPVFADVEATTGLLDMDDVERKTTAATKAVIPVHMYGSMVDMQRLASFCRPRGIRIIEDSAHCIEGKRDGYGPGVLSDLACFSFYATKNLASGEGGAVAGNDPDLAGRVRLLRQHGIGKSAAERHGDEYVHWDMVELGFKYNMFDIQAALLLPQLGRLRPNLVRREDICRRYEAAIDGLEGIEYPAVPQGAASARHLFAVWIRSGKRDRCLEFFGQQGIGVGVHYRAVHTLTWYRNRMGLKPASLPNALTIGNRTISLPLYPSLSDGQVERVVEVLQSASEL